MQRLTTALFLVLLVAGCAQPPAAPEPPAVVTECGDEPAREYRFFFGPELGLNESMPPAGSHPGNGFNEAFLTNNLVTWTSAPVAEGLLIEGNVSLEAWVDVVGTTAPPDTSQPRRAYTFFNQFGSDRAFQSGFATETVPAEQVAGLHHLNETLVMPAGGFTVEKGDRLRVLITSLITDTATGPGTTVMYGPTMPSQIRFSARCTPPVEWLPQRYLRQPIVLPANQGMLAGLPGVDCVNTPTDAVCLNRFEYPFTLENGTERLRIFVRTQEADRVPKTDIDMRLTDPSGNVLYDASTPFVNETMVLWHDNLHAFLPPGNYVLRADLYGGAGYSGLLEIALEFGLDEHDH